jgi:regulator of protease activity HflC (stomatin/prohibitin superfamily)
MAKPKHPLKPGSEPAAADKPVTLRDLLRPETVSKLKEEADAMRAEEARRKEEQRAQAEAARKAEQKRLENDFEHLLNNSSLDWRKFK